MTPEEGTCALCGGVPSAHPLEPSATVPAGCRRFVPIATADDAQRRRYESPAVGAAIRRQVSALVSRCAEGDTEALEELAAVGAAVERATFEGARAIYRAGYTWQHVGDALGITRQGASQRFRKGIETQG